MLSFSMTVGQKSCIQVVNLGYHNRHIYMIFHFRYVTKGNPAKHKLGARLAQVFPCTIMHYALSCTMHYHNIFSKIANHFRRFLDLASWRVIARSALYGSRSSGFSICQSSRSKTEKLSCISRASCAQAPRKQTNAFG